MGRLGSPAYLVDATSDSCPVAPSGYCIEDWVISEALSNTEELGVNTSPASNIPEHSISMSSSHVGKLRHCPIARDLAKAGLTSLPIWTYNDVRRRSSLQPT